MQSLTTFFSAILCISALLVKAENCTTQAINDVLQPMVSDPNYTKCQFDSNYTLQALVSPSLNQTRAFCSSSACQALLNTTLASGLLPDCKVVIGIRSISLLDAIVIVSSKCAPTSAPLKLQERAVDKGDVHSKAQRVSGHVATVLGHSAPMDEPADYGHKSTASTVAMPPHQTPEDADVSSSKQRVDLIIFASHVIPVVPRNVVLLDHAIVVDNSRIVALLPHDEAQKLYIGTEERHLSNHIVTPGLVNLHTHSAMTLLRGLADDRPLCDWLMQDIWPTEGAFVGPDFIKTGMTHAVAEMLRCGTTCCNDMYFFPDQICEVLETTGFRGTVGQVVMEFPGPYGSGADDYFNKAKPNLEKYAPGCHDLITVTMAPHAPYTVSDKSLQRADAMAKEHKVRVHIHLHETASECNDSESLNRQSMSCHQSDQKLRPLANLKRMGLLSEHLICAHMTQLTAEEIDDVAEAGAHVAHCPSSNLKLASGIAPITAMLERGVNVGIGTDGAASNNSLDMFGEMKLAAILAKAQTLKSSSVPAVEALQMATLNGARALGLEKDIGSIEVGKRADVIAVECDSIEMIPMYNAISHVVYVAGREHVSDVWINGKHLLANHKLTTIDEEEVKKSVREWAAKICAHREQKTEQ
ncbi:Metal-dependent hydrolase [Phytophthora cactorum]|nr:Metal-dependent hydrolase [Phytophthora cactorum]